MLRRGACAECAHTNSELGLTGNKLLAALPGSDRARLRECLNRVELPFGKVVHEPGTTRRLVYFPLTSVFSKQYVTATGDAAEVASVGNEGLVGLPLLLGRAGAPIRTVVQVAGSAWCGDKVPLRQELARGGALQNLVLRFAEALMTQMGQNAVCYQRHSVEQQFCLWLLLMLDRVHTDHLRATEELIAQTLSIRRESVSAVTGRLAREGVLRHARGYLEVLDRPHLERRCCECYGVITREYARLLP